MQKTLREFETTKVKQRFKVEVPSLAPSLAANDVYVQPKAVDDKGDEDTDYEEMLVDDTSSSEDEVYGEVPS